MRLVVCQSCVAFTFVGTMENISNAKLLLDYQINHIKVLHSHGIFVAAALVVVAVAAEVV